MCFSGCDKQIVESMQYAEIIVATPGRLKELCVANMIDFLNVSFVVIDEADHLLDMGYETLILRLLQLTRADRQTVMIAGMWPHEMDRVAEVYMNDPISINCISLERNIFKSVDQRIKIVTQRNKFKKVYSSPFHFNRPFTILLNLLRLAIEVSVVKEARRKSGNLL